MKICEYDNIKCPSCGEEREGAEQLNFNGLKEIERGSYQGNISGPMHLILCLSCGMKFGVPCED